MFVREGFEATTMRAIAQRIEYTPTAIYHHFANKHALLTELCTLDFRALALAFRRIGRIDDPVERLARIGAAYVDFGLQHPMQYQLLFMARRPEVTKDAMPSDDPGEDAYAFLRDTCAEVVVSGRLLPEYDDPEELAQMCWGSLHGLVALHIAMGDDAGFIEWRDVGTTAARMSAALLRGMLRPPPD